MHGGRYFLAALALVLAGCGADNVQQSANSTDTTVEAAVLGASETTEAQSDAANNDEAADTDDAPTSTQAAGAASGDVTTTSVSGDDKQTTTSTAVTTTTETQRDSTESSSSTTSTTTSTTTTSTTTTTAAVSGSSSTTSTPAIVLPEFDDIGDLGDLGDIDVLEDILGSLTEIPPPGTEITPLEMIVSKTSGLSDEEVVELQLKNLPAGPYAFGQCSEEAVTAIEAGDLGALLANCENIGLTFDSPGGDLTTSTKVTTNLATTDCRTSPCYLMVAVLPGTEGFRDFVQIEFA